MTITFDPILNELKRYSDTAQHKPWPPRRSKGLRRGRTGKRFIKKWAWDTMEVHSSKVKMSNSDIFLGASDVTDYITGQVMFARSAKQMETFHREFTILATRSEWQKEMLLSELRITQIRENNGMLSDDENLSYFTYEISSSSVIVRVYGNQDFVSKWYDTFIDKYEEVKNVIEWIYNSDGSSIEIPVRADRVPVEEMYPFLNGESLGDYYDRFLHSSASILLLIGPPGTGKTTFIRGLLQHAELSAMVTYDTGILAKDYMFANFIEGDRNVLIIEDADNFLGARTEGNDFMHKFLNVGDGLVTTKNKKMIFSTNLSSIKDIDSALVRPGRCFDVVSFRNLDQNEANALAKRLDVGIEGTKPEWSIADIFHKQIEASKSMKSIKRTLGFM